MSTEQSFGARLVELRGDRPRERFAALLGVQSQVIYRYEQGKVTPNIDFLKLLVEKFSVSADWLLFGEEAGDETDPESLSAARRDSVLSAALQQEQRRLLARLERDLERERTERLELVAENRKLHKDKEELLLQLGVLKVQLARLEGAGIGTGPGTGEQRPLQQSVPGE